MFLRCYSPEDKSYHRYGGRGIIVCDRWFDFRNFLADMGEKPSQKHSIDRINNDGNYEPGNCRWATASQQRHNRPDLVMTVVNGTPISAAELAHKLGMRVATVVARVKYGWSGDRIANTPPQKHRHQDLSGVRFGRLTAKQVIGRMGSSSVWKCDCDCGGTKEATASDLKRGSVRSCGCLPKGRKRA